MWQVIPDARGANFGNGRRTATNFRVHRSPRNGQAYVTVPHTAAKADRFDWLSDGNGKLALFVSSKGKRKLSRPGPEAKCRYAFVPKDYTHMFPYGSHDLETTDDGGMVVIDTAQFRG